MMECTSSGSTSCLRAAWSTRSPISFEGSFDFGVAALGAAITTLRTSFPVRGSARTTTVLRSGGADSASAANSEPVGEAATMANPIIKQIYNFLFRTTIWLSHGETYAIIFS